MLTIGHPHTYAKRPTASTYAGLIAIPETGPDTSVAPPLKTEPSLQNGGHLSTESRTENPIAGATLDTLRSFFKPAPTISSQEIDK